MEKWYGQCFEVRTIASRINETFSAIKKKEQGVLLVFRV